MPRSLSRTRGTAVALALALPAALLTVGTAGAAPGKPGAKPTAPTRLVVDDLTRPLDAATTPRFGWLPQDVDPDEVQTAYKIEVRDEAGRIVWDTDKVSSRQQSYVEYAGADLERGAAYTWRVRTWDSDKRPSPWSEWESFETAISDADWGDAAWIRRPAGNPDASALSIVDGRGRVSGGNVTIAKAGTDWTDYVVSMDVTPITRAAAVVFRAPDAATGYMWQLHANDDAIKTHRMTGGAFPTDARRTVPYVIDPGVTYRLGIEVQGQTFQTSINGTVVDTWTDPSATGSRAGTIGFREASGEVADFDNVSVTSLDGASTLFSEDFSGDLSKWVRGSTGQEADEYTLARTEVDVPAGEIVRARSYLAASHTAELYLDGERADRMSNYGYPSEGYYQVADVTDLVRPGERLSVGAMLHWFSAGQGRAAGVPGLLARIVVDYADGSSYVLTTDGSWKVRRGPYVLVGTRNGEGLYVEHRDGPAAKAIGDWTAVGYDDSGWSDAVVIGKHPVAPFTTLEAQQTRLTETVVHPERILTAQDGTPVADFGKVIPARPAVHFEQGVAGRVVPIRASYGLATSGRVSTSGVDTQGTNMSFPYTQVAGKQDYAAFGHLGFRYLEVPGAGEDISVDDVSATVVTTAYPEGGEATFSSSDETLDAVWDLMARSLEYSVQETFVDTPTREQGQFLHDTVNISYGLMATHSERVASRQAIREFMLSQARYWRTGNDAGRYNAVYPNGDGKRDIPDFTEVVPDWIWRYYLETGDTRMLEQTYDELAATAGYVRRHIATSGPTQGLVTQLSGGSGQYLHGIVDWPAHGRFGYDMTATARTTVNALGVDVLRKVALVAEALGRPDAEVAAYRSDADALAGRMNATLRKSDGTYVDGLLGDGSQSPHAGQHATSYAVALGIAPEADVPALGDHLAGMGMKQGPMTVHWLVEALAESGRGDALRTLLTNEDDYGWAGWLKQGGTFTPEAWELSGSANSASHGWGSRAAVDLLSDVLGIDLAAPGGSELSISIPDTGLTQAEGTRPTQHGTVASSWTRDAAGTSLTTTIPVNTTAIVELPAGDYTATGRGGARPVKVAGGDGTVRYEVGSGTWSFTTD